MVRMPMTGTSKRMSCLAWELLTPVRRLLRRVLMERLHQRAGALDGGVSALHGLDGHAGLAGNHHRLADVIAGDGACHFAPVSDVEPLLLAGLSRGEGPRLSQQRLEIRGRRDQLDAF